LIISFNNKIGTKLYYIFYKSVNSIIIYVFLIFSKTKYDSLFKNSLVKNRKIKKAPKKNVRFFCFIVDGNKLSIYSFLRLKNTIFVRLFGKTDKTDNNIKTQ
jgi:hypothetical protein